MSRNSEAFEDSESEISDGFMIINSVITLIDHFLFSWLNFAKLCYDLNFQCFIYRRLMFSRLID